MKESNQIPSVLIQYERYGTNSHDHPSTFRAGPVSHTSPVCSSVNEAN